MKILLLLFVGLLIFAGCSFKQIEKRMVITGYDFTEYTKKGFLITPEKYNGEYESIGILNLYMNPKVYMHEELVTDEYAYLPVKKKTIVRDEIDPYEGIDSLYSLAVSMGADAIINFSIKDDYFFDQVAVPYIFIKGFAIKRK